MHGLNINTKTKRSGIKYDQVHGVDSSHDMFNLANSSLKQFNFLPYLFLAFAHTANNLLARLVLQQIRSSPNGYLSPQIFNFPLKLVLQLSKFSFLDILCHKDDIQPQILFMITGTLFERLTCYDSYWSSLIFDEHFCSFEDALWTDEKEFV